MNRQQAGSLLFIAFFLAASLAGLPEAASAQSGPSGGSTVATVLMTGFLAGSNPGLQILQGKLQNAFGSIPGLGFASQVFTFTEGANAASFIASLGNVGKVVLIGHSLGAEAIFNLVQNILGPQGIAVDLAIPIDFVEVTSPFTQTTPSVPSGIAKTLYYHQVSTGFLEPVPAVTIIGARRNLNVEVLLGDPSITHTSIDCDPRVHELIITRLRELLGLLPYPGTSEDLDTLCRIDTLNVPCQPALGIAVPGGLIDTPILPVSQGQQVTIRSISPEGVFAGSLFILLGEIFPTSAPPSPLIPGIASSLNPTTIFAITPGPTLQLAPFNPAPLPGIASATSFCWPAGLQGTSLLFQTIVVDPAAQNGLFASSTGIELRGI